MNDTALHDTALHDTALDDTGIPTTGVAGPTRRRVLAAALAVPVVGAAPFVVDRWRADDSAPRSGEVLRLTSNNGRFQAWAEPLPEGATIYAPGPRGESTITVRDRLTGESRTMTLARNLEPEAFSADGRTLFAIDHRPALHPEVYRVSSIDVAAGVVADTLGPSKVPLGDEMRGDGRQQVWSPRGDQLYTLYIRQHHDHAASHDPAASEDPAASQDHGDDGAVDAFVHVLDVENDWALCVELPEGIGLGPAGSTAIVVDGSGTTITVVDHALGATVDVVRLAGIGEFAVGTLDAIGAVSPPG